MTTPPVPQWAVDAAKALDPLSKRYPDEYYWSDARIIAEHAPQETEDRARLDWMEAQAGHPVVSILKADGLRSRRKFTFANYSGGWGDHETVRAAIDAARKKDL